MLTPTMTAEKGHSKRECSVEQAEDEFERVVLKCGNCSALDHRLRDCPEPRKPDFNPNACKNCRYVSVPGPRDVNVLITIPYSEEGHRAAECPLPRVADENTECRKCGGSKFTSRKAPLEGY